MNSLTRLLQGFIVFNSMALILVIFEVTPMNIEQWEERYLTDEELSRIRSEERRREVRTQKYWAVRKLNQRDERFVKNYHRYKGTESPEIKDLRTAEHLIDRWNDFVKDMLIMSIESNSAGKSLSWSCKLTRLHMNYLIDKSKLRNFNHASCISFDSYLYSKISRSSYWFECNYNENLTVWKEWCLAWSWYKTPDFKSDLMEPMIDGLLSEIELKECTRKPKNDLMELPSSLYQRKGELNSVLDLTICFLSTLAPTLLTWKSDFQKILGRPR